MDLENRLCYGDIMAKEPQELKWIESLLPEDEYRRRAMFGGFGYYLSEKMVLATFESTGNRTYKKKKYPYEIWNGCMFPVEREYQEKALQRFPFLGPHPILPKWLYLPLETENFEDLVSDVMAQVIKPGSYWGSIPKPKSKKKRVKEDSSDWEKIDTRTPRMFSDEPPENILGRAAKISELKNLGPKAEKEFHKAGIKTVKQFVKLGWQKTMVKLVKANGKNRHSIFAYAIIGALANKDWTSLSAEEREEVRNFVRSLPRP